MSLHQPGMIRRHQLDISEKGLFSLMPGNSHNGEGRSAGEVFIGGKASPGRMGREQLPLLMSRLLPFALFGKGSDHFLRETRYHFSQILKVVIGLLIAERSRKQ